MFYDRFIFLCKKRNIKPTPLVLEMGLSSSNVSQWKKGSTPRPEVLQRIADYFQVSVEYLLSGDDNKKEPAPIQKNEGKAYSNEALWDAFQRADDSTKAAIRILLKMDQGE